MVYEKGIILQITLLPRELRAKGVKYESKGRRLDFFCCLLWVWLLLVMVVTIVAVVVVAVVVVVVAVVVVAVVVVVVTLDFLTIWRLRNPNLYKRGARSDWEA